MGIGKLGGVLGALACAAVPLLSFATSTAQAQPARVPGLDCRSVAGQSNVWQTTFWGWKVDDFGFRQEFMASPCFTSEANCKAWLYWARSDFDPNYVPPKLCHRVS